METNDTLIKSSHTIPLDILLDVFRILLKNNIGHRAEAVNEKESSLLIQISLENNNTVHQKAMQNIEVLLSDYGYFLKGSPAD